MVLIPAGEFMMGSPEDEKNRDAYEGPQHRVRITKPFYLGVYVVTQEEYERVMGINPSYFASSGAGKKNVIGQDTRRFPAEENVSWDDAMDFCRRLSALPEEKAAGHMYALPTEAQWEYACRAGTTTPFSFGSVCNGREANCVGDSPYGTGEKGPRLERTTAVGSYPPNAFGLYDMHGNVWQWCADRWGSGYYAASPLDDPVGPASGSYRILRGGAWGFQPRDARSAYRRGLTPDKRNNCVGFRVSRNPSDGQKSETTAIGSAPEPKQVTTQSGAKEPPLAVAPFDAEQAKEHQQAWAKSLDVPVEITNSIGMKMALIPAGEFMMGSPEDEKERSSAEGPHHRVRITKPFYLGVYAVTQEEYQQVTGKNPSYFSRDGGGKSLVAGKNTGRFPVENVSWDDAMEFCRRLSALPEEKAARHVYGLPTEAQWEYACRAGTTTPFSFGSVCNGRQANCDGNYPCGTKEKGPYLGRTTTVGSYEPNAFGLYDMHGNVWQWCAGGFGNGYYSASPTDDPTGPTSGLYRVNRGGGWVSTAGGCRSADRGINAPGAYPYLGFRVSLALAEKQVKE